jgi:hypothetical protein
MFPNVIQSEGKRSPNAVEGPRDQWQYNDRRSFSSKLAALYTTEDRGGKEGFLRVFCALCG